MGGLLVHFVPSFLVIVLPPSSTVYAFIVDVEGYSGQFFGIAVSVGLILLRWREPDLKRPYRAWLPAVGLRVILSVFLILAPFFASRKDNSDVDFWYATYVLVAVSMFVPLLLMIWIIH